MTPRNSDVASHHPGGTTERAIDVFQKNNFEGIVLQALQAAADRSRELATEFGKG